MTYESDSLAHYGIKGQSWGVRRFQNEDGSLTEAGKQRYGYYTNKDGTKDYKRINNDAQNDAREYARAKAYYGEGAGTRRKKIKNQISERMKDPDYKKAFDEHMKNQNMEEHQRAADKERRWEDTKTNVGKTARGVKNLMLGLGSASLAAVALYGVAKHTGLGEKLKSWGQTAISKITGLFKPKDVSADYKPDWAGPEYDMRYGYEHQKRQEDRRAQEDRKGAAAVEKYRNMYSSGKSASTSSSGYSSSGSSSSRSSDRKVGDEQIRSYWSNWSEAAIKRQSGGTQSSRPMVNNPAKRKLKYDSNGRPYWE